MGPREDKDTGIASSGTAGVGDEDEGSTEEDEGSPWVEDVWQGLAGLRARGLPNPGAGGWT